MGIVKIENGIVTQLDKTTDKIKAGWVKADDNTFPGMIDNGDGTFLIPPKTAKKLEAERIQNIKDEAGKRIKKNVPTAKASDSKEKLLEREVNLMMLNAELDDIKINGGSLDANQQAQKDAFIALKNLIKDIRAMADAAAINGDSLAKFISDLDAKGM